jgi:hypothetical protein
MGRGGPNGPSSLPCLRLRSSDSNRPCRLLGGRLGGLQEVDGGGRGPGFRFSGFSIFRGSGVTGRAGLRSKSVRKQAGTPAR